MKQLSKRFVIFGTLLIWLIKFVVRPLHLAEGSHAFFMGLALNIIGFFLTPFGAYWFFCGRDHLVARVFRIRTPYDLRLVCILGFGMLVVNEYLQRIPVFGRTFDYNDIIFSSVGLLAACMVFGKLQARHQPQHI